MNPTDIWEAIAYQLKDSPMVLICLAWIVAQQRQIISLTKRNAELESLMRQLNDKIMTDIVPLLTRLLDLVPDLVSQVQRRK